MNQLTLGEKQIKWRIPISILALLAFALTFLSRIQYFVVYYTDRYGSYRLSFEFPTFISLLTMFLTLVPFVLMLLYVITFYIKFDVTVFAPVIFVSIAFNPAFCLMVDYIRGYNYKTIYLLLYLGIIISFLGLAVYCALKGLDKKIFLIIASAIAILYEFLSLITYFKNFIWYIENGFYLYLFTDLLAIIGATALYVSLLLFGLTNNVLSVSDFISSLTQKNNQTTEHLTPEQALIKLNENLALGTISEEEYRAKREEIINNL